MRKNELIHRLINNTKLTIKPSKIEGVGVFSICDIEKNTDPFGEEVQNYIKVKPSELVNVPAYVLDLISKYYILVDGFYELPSLGMSLIDLKCFVNHSDDPNCIWINNGESARAIKDIKQGEEITIDFRLLPDFDEEKDKFANHG